MSQESIQTDKVVSIHYELRLADGREVERSPRDQPLVYLHGNRNIIPGLEEELQGKQSGDKLNTVVQPDQAYGERSPEGIRKVPRSAFAPDLDLQVGLQLAVQTEDGQPVPLRVLELKDEEVVVDLNHPLAGESLHFDVEVVSVRDATPEEIEHGHPHEGGTAH